MRFPALYKLNSRGKIQIWSIQTDLDTITTTFGLLDGKQQTLVEKIGEGKNLGRQNETSPESQAEAEAQSRWNQRVKREGYVQDYAMASRGEDATDGGIAPMLAHPIEKIKEKYFSWPARVEPKLDGYRCIALKDDSGEIGLWTRKRERITSLPHVEAAIATFLEGTDIRCLDGELFTQELRFQEISSYVRSREPQPGSEAIQYHVYDLPFSVATQAERSAILGGLQYSDTVRQVPGSNVESLAKAWELHHTFVGQGYEGAILRQLGGIYQIGKRSNNLAKLKCMSEEDFRILDAVPGRGKFSDVAVFVCETPQGAQFSCNAPGSLGERKMFLQDRSLWEGRQLSVKFFGLTDDGLPRFPVGKVVRFD